MRILVVGPGGRTGRHIVQALQRRPETAELVGFSRSDPAIAGVEHRAGDLECPADRARACAGVDTVVHYGPPIHPREAALGTGMIDAALAAGVRRFVFVSVIHPQIDDLLNHAAKLAVEAHLLDTTLDWTIVRPQHLMQNVDVAALATHGVYRLPYARTARLGQVDLADVAEVTAKVTLEAGHSYASYDLSTAEHLSGEEIAAIVGRLAGRAIAVEEIAPAAMIARIGEHRRLGPYEIEAFHRLSGYYSRHGIRGNPGVLAWLLGRPPTGFEAYVARGLDRMDR